MQPLRSLPIATAGLAAALLGTVAGCGDTEPDRRADEPGTVTIDDFAFAPEALTIGAGASVTWTNRDDVTHSVTQNAELLDSPDLSTGDDYEVTFDEPGSYEYFCKFHPAMRAIVTVEG